MLVLLRERSGNESLVTVIQGDSCCEAGSLSLWRRPIRRNRQSAPATRPLRHSCSCRRRFVAQSPATGSTYLLVWIVCGFPVKQPGLNNLTLKVRPLIKYELEETTSCKRFWYHLPWRLTFTGSQKSISNAIYTNRSGFSELRVSYAMWEFAVATGSWSKVSNFYCRFCFSF